MTALLRTYLRPYGARVALVLTLLLLQAVANLYLPSLNADIINNGVVKGDTGYITRIGGLMLLVTFALTVAAVIGVYYGAGVAMAFGRDVRAALFRRVQSFSLREVNKFGAPSLITRNTNDVQQLQMFVVMGLTMMVAAPITMVGGIIMAVREDVRLSALLLVVVPLMAAVIGALIWRAIPLFRSMQGRIDKVNRVTRETLAGIRVVRAFVRTTHEEERFAEANDELTRATLTVNRLFALMFPSLMLIMNLSSIAIIWFGSGLVDSGSMPIGNLTAFLSYLMQILFAVMMATFMTVMVPRAQASAERIQEVLTTEPDIHDPVSAAVTLPAQRTDGADLDEATVEFRDVEFRYPGAEEPVLRRINLTLPAGRTTAIVGGTGAGKSTLVNLIPRLYDVTAGAVLIDGVDVREMPQEQVWSRLGLVPQKSFLFSGTVADNVRFGRPDAADEQVWQALEVAQAAGFVREMPDGLQSPIEQGGANVSGGQRQRLAIARAVAKQPAVYLLDDCFSALDFATDARLRAALREHTSTATVVIVAQRVSTVMHADQIVVLDLGTVVGVGTHTDLMRDCETYREIVLSQLTEDDVA
ncbi:MAG TPA: ABC transporter ATP-binding protein [Kineosporiaceae bacterium]|nr:ABC transporter ATP-binding protein [Kineosporiaceae bacterium]